MKGSSVSWRRRQWAEYHIALKILIQCQDHTICYRDKICGASCTCSFSFVRNRILKARRTFLACFLAEGMVSKHCVIDESRSKFVVGFYYITVCTCRRSSMQWRLQRGHSIAMDDTPWSWSSSASLIFFSTTHRHLPGRLWLIRASGCASPPNQLQWICHRKPSITTALFVPRPPWQFRWLESVSQKCCPSND